MDSARRFVGHHRPWVACIASLMTLGFGLAVTSQAAEPKVWLDPRVQAMPTDKMGPFVRLQDGGILTAEGVSAFISKDEGKTWSSPIPMFPADQPVQISNERALLRTKDGTIVLAFMNLKTRSKGYWDVKTKELVPDVRLDVWTVRSRDEGKTWTDAHLVQQGYSGAVRALVEAEDGRIVLATQDVLHKPARHVVTAYYSTDKAKSWTRAEWVDAKGTRSPSFDIGGHGHHDGAVEPTVERLKDGRLWMLIRTGHDRFWQSFSTDQGVTWTNTEASPIAASAAPAMLKRLDSGRLLLAWNQLYPEGKTNYERKGPDWHEKPASYHREELSLALSDDDGKTWSPAVVIAQQPGKWLSYPYMFERAPGEIWLTTMQGGLRLVVKEQEILSGSRFHAKGESPASPAVEKKGSNQTRRIDPEFIGPVNLGANLVILPDGTWEAFRAINSKGTFKLARTRSNDQGRTWSALETLRDLPGEGWGGAVALRDRQGAIQLFFLRLRLNGDAKTARKIAVDRFIDLWHLRSTSTGDGQGWSEPRRIFEGYIGSAQMALQLASGRIILPFGSWVAERKPAPPTGANFCTLVYSDDDGKTWTQSSAQLVAPCHEGFNGNNYGACEPSVIQRNDGQVWMLMRTQDGFLYESYSKDGAEWSPAKPSRFRSSSSPAAIAKLGDGRLVVAWNHCEMPPRAEGKLVYGGRDALHLAIADPQGEHWRGFREVYLDTRRNDSPPKSGDRGTAYPFLIVAKDGRIGVVSGQGAGRRTLTLVHPDWLRETERADQFEQGLAHWSVFTEFGPARGAWRDRTPGAQLNQAPESAQAKVLELGTTRGTSDGAVWNFPAGQRGSLTLKVRLANAFNGGSIALADRFFNPTDDHGESLAPFRLSIAADGKLAESDAAIGSEKWTSLNLKWDLAVRQCEVLLDGQKVASIPLTTEANPSGLSYLRIRGSSKHPEEDHRGLVIASVAANVESD